MTNRSSGAKRDWRDVHLSSSYRWSRREFSRERSRDRESKRRRKDSRSHSRDRGRSRSRSRLAPRKDTNGELGKHHNHREKEGEEGEYEEGELVEDSPRALPSRSPSSQPQMKVHPTMAPEEPLPDLELEIPPSPPPLEMTLAERRKRRAEILAKYSSAAGTPESRPSPANGTPQAVTPEQFPPPPPETPATRSLSPVHHQPIPEVPSGLGNLDTFELTKGQDDDQQRDRLEGDVDAADYDPSLDRREDASRLLNQPQSDDVAMLDVQDDAEEIEVEEEEDVDDMFAISPSDSPARPKAKKVLRKKVPKAKPVAVDVPLDATDDPEGYYTPTLGEVLDNGRYQVFAKVGSGMFAVVVKARVLQAEDGTPFDPHVPKREVAIKIMRSQASMHKSGLREASLLTKLNHADPDDKKHIVRLERTFEWRGHLCLVLEGLNMNLREILKKFGRDVGLNVRAVRAYACQMFMALSLLKKEGVTHADVKPDNILVNTSNTHLKLCDLGSAADAESGEPTPYLVSRFYRSPEVILGLPYDTAIDMWSIGCTLFELYTGRILFPGRDNRQMLQLHMEAKGRFNSKQLKKARFADMYFDELGMFMIGDKKHHISTKPSRDLKSRLSSVEGGRDERMVRDLIDLLDKCLTLDPARRITPKEALGHAFCRSA